MHGLQQQQHQSVGQEPHVVHNSKPAMEVTYGMVVVVVVVVMVVSLHSVLQVNGRHIRMI